MPSGTPDFGRADAAAVTHQVADLAEQAARVASIVTFHRGGEVVWLDDFEGSVLKWAPQIGGTGASVALSTVDARNGIQSVLLTAGSTASNQATIFRNFPFPSAALIGAEYSFIIDSLPDTLRLGLAFFDGTNLLLFRLFLDFTNDRIEVLNSSGSEESVSSPLSLDADTFNFHTVKLIVNRSTGAYVRMFLDNRQVDLSAISGQSSSDSTNPTLQVDVRNIGDLSANDTIYVDDFILTQNEP